MSKKLKILRRFVLLEQPDCFSRQRGKILQEFLEGRLGILSLDEWFRLYQLFSNFYTRRKILICVQGNIKNGSLSGKDKMHISPYKEFVGKVWPRMK